MKYALSNRGRTVLLFLSAASYIAWFSGLGERGAAQGMPGATAFISLQRPEPRSSNIALAILRDPFDGHPKQTRADGATRANDDSAAATDGSLAAADGILAAAGNSASVAAANSGAAAAHSGGSNGSPTVPDIAVGQPTHAVELVVHATITGPNPVAYVEDGTSVDIVRVGDTLGGQRVASIDLRGLAFAGGARLDLPDGYAPPPPPPRTQADRTVLFRLSDLRRLFGFSRSAHPEPDGATTTGATTTKVTTTNGTPSASPSASAAAPDARPAPLRTADSRGFAVGTNPTPDSGSATPEPYPYPYAPPR